MVLAREFFIEMYLLQDTRTLIEDIWHFDGVLQLQSKFSWMAILDWSLHFDVRPQHVYSDVAPTPWLLYILKLHSYVISIILVIGIFMNMKVREVWIGGWHFCRRDGKREYLADLIVVVSSEPLLEYLASHLQKRNPRTRHRNLQNLRNNVHHPN